MEVLVRSRDRPRRAVDPGSIFHFPPFPKRPPPTRWGGGVWGGLRPLYKLVIPGAVRVGSVYPATREGDGAVVRDLIKPLKVLSRNKRGEAVGSSKISILFE